MSTQIIIAINMSYLKVLNPEKIDVKTGFKGQYYDIKAGEEKSFPEDLARWFVDTYPFLLLKENTEAPTRGLPKEVPVLETVAEEVKEVVDKKVKK